MLHRLVVPHYPSGSICGLVFRRLRPAVAAVATSPQRMSFCTPSLRLLKGEEGGDLEFLSEIDRIITSSSNVQERQKTGMAQDGLEAAAAAAAAAAAGASSPTEYFALQQLTNKVFQLTGRRPRLLLASFHSLPGLGRKEDELAPGLADMGFDCDISPACRTPEDVSRMAVEADVHAIILIASPPVQKDAPGSSAHPAMAKRKLKNKQLQELSRGEGAAGGDEAFSIEEEREKLQQDVEHLHALQAALKEKNAEDILLSYVGRKMVGEEGAQALQKAAVLGVHYYPHSATSTTIAKDVLQYLLDGVAE